MAHAEKEIEKFGELGDMDDNGGLWGAMTLTYYCIHAEETNKGYMSVAMIITLPYTCDIKIHLLFNGTLSHYCTCEEKSDGEGVLKYSVQLCTLASKTGGL